MPPPIEVEPIVHVILFFIVLFIASVFWVSYHRIRSFKFMLTAVAFTLVLGKIIIHHFLEIEGPQPFLALIDLLAFSFIALSFYRRKQDEDESEDGDEEQSPDPSTKSEKEAVNRD